MGVTYTEGDAGGSTDPEQLWGVRNTAHAQRGVPAAGGTGGLFLDQPRWDPWRWTMYLISLSAVSLAVKWDFLYLSHI